MHQKGKKMSDEIPKGIKIEELPNGRPYPSPYIDTPEIVFWNNSKTHFVLIYSIIESSMTNYSGQMIWAKQEDNKPQILGHIDGVYIKIKWLNDEVFIFKNSNGSHKEPIKAIHIDKGIHVCPNTETYSRDLDIIKETPNTFTKIE